jgi:hypothetical protein
MVVQSTLREYLMTRDGPSESSGLRVDAGDFKGYADEAPDAVGRKR